VAASRQARPAWTSWRTWSWSRWSTSTTGPSRRAPPATRCCRPTWSAASSRCCATS
jgi:hypothetical protein